MIPPGMMHPPPATQIVRRISGEATSYCEHGRTASGRMTHRGTVATDPRTIPMGSYILVQEQVYRADDTGSAVKGNIIDIWAPSCRQSIEWGRRKVEIAILGAPLAGKKIAPRIQKPKHLATRTHEASAWPYLVLLGALLLAAWFSHRSVK